MPVYKEFTENKTRLLIWKYDENEAGEDIGFLDKETQEKIKNLHVKRQKEVLMVRKILNILLPHHQLLYHDSGEPYLEPSEFHIAIGHSFPFAAVAISEEKIGIDIERVGAKIQRVKPRFLHATEYDWVENENELDFLTAIWTIKESLYKIHPSKYWSFRDYYKVEKFELSSEFKTKCYVFDEKFKDDFVSKTQKIEDCYYLTMVKEKPH